jgi:hypothetical protein
MEIRYSDANKPRKGGEGVVVMRTAKVRPRLCRFGRDVSDVDPRGPGEMRGHRLRFL